MEASSTLAGFHAGALSWSNWISQEALGQNLESQMNWILNEYINIMQISQQCVFGSKTSVIHFLACYYFTRTILFPTMLVLTWYQTHSDVQVLSCWKLSIFELNSHGKVEMAFFLKRNNSGNSENNSGNNSGNNSRLSTAPLVERRKVALFFRVICFSYRSKLCQYKGVEFV